MEKKIVYLKLFQILFTLTIIWQLISLHQFCGTFADPKVFLCGDCKRITLIGKDAETGEFGIVSYTKLYSQFFMNSTNGQLTEEQQRQFFDKFAATLPPAGHECIPITITPFDSIFDWIGMLDRNPLKTRTLFLFSDLFLFALVSLGILGYGIMKMLCSMEEYKEFWTCVNFRAYHANVPLHTLLLSLYLVCSSILEIVLHKFMLNDVDMESANVMMIIDQQQLPKKKNGSACCAIE